jgi:hypothetical protein
MLKRRLPLRMFGLLALTFTAPALAQTPDPSSERTTAPRPDATPRAETRIAESGVEYDYVEGDENRVYRSDTSYMAMRFATVETHTGGSFTLRASPTQVQNPSYDVGLSLFDVQLVSVERESALGWNFTLGSAAVHLDETGLSDTYRDGGSGEMLPEFSAQALYRFDTGGECRPAVGGLFDQQNMIMNDVAITPGGGSGRIRGGALLGLACTNGRYAGVASVGTGGGIIDPHNLDTRRGDVDFTNVLTGRLDFSADGVFLHLMGSVDFPLSSPTMVTGQMSLRFPVAEIPFNILGGNHGELYMGMSSQVSVRPEGDGSYLGDGFSAHALVGIQETNQGRFVGDTESN